MNITISVTDEFLKKLDKVRGLASRSAYLRWAVENKVESVYQYETGPKVQKPVDSAVMEKLTNPSYTGNVPAPSGIVDRFTEARAFCKRMSGLGYEPDYEQSLLFEKEALEIAKRSGLEVVGRWFKDVENDKFICKW